MPDKLPFMQFFPTDWLADPALRSCSLPARGLWIDLLCQMWQCQDRGYLRTNGKPWTAKQISNAVGVGVAQVERLLKELRVASVFDMDGDGCITNRRMVREEIEREGNRGRQRDYRERVAANADVTPKKQECNADVTGHILETTFQKLESNTNLASDPKILHQEAHRIYRRRCGRNFGPFSAIKGQWSGFVAKVEASEPGLILEAVAIWAGDLEKEKRRWLPDNPQLHFLKNADKYLGDARDTRATKAAPQDEDDPVAAKWRPGVREPKIKL